MEIGGSEVASVDDALDVFEAGLAGLIEAVEAGGLDGYEGLRLVGFLQRFERARNRMALVDHRAIRTAEALRLPDALTQPSMVGVLATTLRLSRGEAARRVRAAEQVGERVAMTGEPLVPLRPALAAAQRAGEASPEQVDVCLRAIGQVDHRGFDPADLAAADALLAGFTRTFGPKPLGDLAAQVVERIDPDGSRPDDQLNADRRHLAFRKTRDGLYTVEGRLTGAVGAKLHAVLSPLAAPRVGKVTLGDGRLVEEPDPRHHGQRTHDALEEVCDRLLRSGTLPDSGGTPATVIVTITEEQLRARQGTGTTSDGTRLSAKTALRARGRGRRVRGGPQPARGRPRSGPDAALRQPRPDRRADRPRPRLQLPRLHATAGMVRAAPRRRLGRRGPDQPFQLDPLVRLSPPPLRRPGLDLPDDRRPADLDPTGLGRSGTKTPAERTHHRPTHTPAEAVSRPDDDPSDPRRSTLTHVNATQELLAAVQARAVGTPYVVEPTPEGFDVRLRLDDPRWFGTFRERRLVEASIHHVRTDDATKTCSIDDELRSLTWRAGADGRERPVLGASFSVSVSRGKIRSRSVRRTYSLGQGGVTKTSEVTFDSSAGRDLVADAAKQLGWTLERGSHERIGLAVGVGAIGLLVLAGIVVGIVALAGGFS